MPDRYGFDHLGGTFGVSTTLELYANLDNWEHVGEPTSKTWRWTGSLGPPWVPAQDALQSERTSHSPGDYSDRPSARTLAAYGEAAP